ncbi:unnamed protein product, partial [Meganyctiphanes norvegica]
SPCRRPGQSPPLRRRDHTRGLMQHNIEEIRRRLLSCIDSQHNVTDMSQCLEIISLLERTAITRELLEATRLGKHINDIRRKTSHQELYRRAKDLVRKWRRMYVLQEGVNGTTPSAGPAGPGSGAGPGGGGVGGVGGNCGGGSGGGSSSAGAGNGHPPTSPSSLPSSCNTSPGLSRPSTPSTIPSRSRTLSPTLTTSQAGVSKSKPYSPALSGLNHGLSPAMSRPGPRSPCVSPSMANAKQRSKSQTPHSPAVNKLQSVESRADASSYNMTVENVAKSNTANKRLRKDEDYENSSDIPSFKRAKNSIPPSSVITNGQVEDEWSRDSFSSILSNDNKFNQTSASSENNKNMPKRTLNSGSTPVAGKHKLHKQTPITPKQEHKSHKHDSIKQDSNKMSSIKSAKVKTTSQLVQDLANRKGDQKLAERAIKLGEEQQMRELTQVVPVTDPDVISRNKREHMEKFLKSHPDVGYTEGDVKSPYSSDGGVGAESAPAVSPPPSPGGLPSVQFPVRQIVSNLDLLGVMPDETAEEILARLPPIDLDSIVWDDEPEEEEKDGVKEETEKVKKEEVKGSGSGSDEGSDGESEVDEYERLLEGASKVKPEVVDTLHSTNVDYQNGNFDTDGKFREWHEVFNKKSYQDELLPVLPYVITDY